MLVHGVGCSVSACPSHANLSVRKTLGHVKNRQMVRVSGISPPVHLMGFNNDIKTLERAVKERVFFVKTKDGAFVPPPRPAKGFFRATLNQSVEQLRKFLPKTAPLSRYDFVETFRGRKKRIYQFAADSLLNTGNLTVKDSFITPFVKYEKTDHTTKADPVPRVVSPRNPRYNVELGRFLRPLEERIFKAIGELFGHKTVFKGMNAELSAKCMFEKWSMFRDPVAVGLDASRFDQHCSEEALKTEHGIYLDCYPTKKRKRQLEFLLKMQLKNICVGYVPDGRVKYKTVGTRMSGDMNTSLGNCILMCLMIHSYGLARNVNLQLANNGDDCVVIMDKTDLPKFQLDLDDWFLSMGFNMAVEEPCYTFEEIEFCQTHPVWVGPHHDSYIMVRHPVKAIAKDTACLHPWQTRDVFAGWMHAVGTGGMSMTGQIPIFQDFYKSFIAAGTFRMKTSDPQGWGVKMLGRGLSRSYGKIDALTRASFYWAFGVTPDEQICAENYYGAMDLSTTLSEGVVDFQAPLPL